MKSLHEVSSNIPQEMQTLENFAYEGIEEKLRRVYELKHSKKVPLYKLYGEWMNLLSNKGIARGEIFTKNAKDGTYKIKQYHGRGPKWVKAKVIKLHYSSKFTKIMKKASPKKRL